MVIIGIVGGIGSGKSLVAEQFQQLGAAVIHGDQIGHEVLQEASVKQAIHQQWGREVFDSHGDVDRAMLASRVFATSPEGTRELACLEQITHPEIARRIRQRANELASQGSYKAVILDAAVLLKAGWDSFCDKIVFVEAPREQRFERVQTRGWSSTEFAAREAAQKTLDEKRICADWVIDNGGTPAHTLAQVERIWQCLD